MRNFVLDFSPEVFGRVIALPRILAMGTAPWKPNGDIPHEEIETLLFSTARNKGIP